MGFEGDRVELADYARIVWKRKWLIIVPTVLVLASAFLALRTMTPIYVAKATLEILESDEVEQVVTDVLGEKVRTRNREKGYEKVRLNQIRQQVTGQEFLERVAIELGLDADEGVLKSAESKQARMPNLSIDELVKHVMTARLEGKIGVANAGINHFLFLCEHEDPVEAYNLVSAIIAEYVDYVRSVGTASTDRTVDFTQEQLDAKRKDLEDAEQTLREFQARINRVNMNSGNPITSSNLSDARLLSDQADVEITRLEGRVERGLERLEAYSSASVLRGRASSGKLDRLASSLAAAERDEVSLLIQGTSAQADVSRIRQDIFNEMRSRVAAAFPDEEQRIQNQIGDVIFDHIILDTVRARKSEIRRLMSGFTDHTTQTTAQDLELQKLEGAVSDLRGLVSNLDQQLHEAQFKDSAKQISAEHKVSVVDPPQVPREPDRPNRFRILLMALVAGPVLGFGAVFLTEYLDTSMKTVEEIEEVLGLPVLGTIPKLVPANMQSHNKRRRARSRSKVGTAGMLLLVAGACAASSGQVEPPVTGSGDVADVVIGETHG